MNTTQTVRLGSTFAVAVLLLLYGGLSPARSEAQAPRATPEAADEVRLEQIIAEMPQNDQAVMRHGFRAIQQHPHRSTHFDPIAYALELRKLYHRLMAEGQVARESKVSSVTLGIVGDRLRRERSERAALSRERWEPWFTPELARAIGERYVDAILANPPLFLWNQVPRGVGNPLSQAVSDARQAQQVADKQAAAAEDAAAPLPPWLTPERAGEYVLIPTGRDQRGPQLTHFTVYHVATGQVVAQQWRAEVGSRRSPRLVRDAPARLWLGDAMVVNLKDGKIVSSASGGQRSYVMAPDRRRVVVFEGGDVWRGEFDWGTGKIVNRHQVTRVGLFRQPMRPVVWHGNDIYLPAGFDKEKPIVRVNLVSGDLEELEAGGVFDPLHPPQQRPAMGHNPPGWLLIRPEGQIVHTLDLRTGQARTVPNPGTRKDQPGSPTLWRGADLHWLDDTTAVVGTTRGIFRFDFVAGRATALTRSHLVPVGHVQRERVDSLDGSLSGVRFVGPILPDGQWAMVSAIEAVTQPKPAPAPGHEDVKPDPFLLNLSSGVIERIDMEGPLPDIRRSPRSDEWLDDRHYVFSRRTGGLSVIGTWIYDRQSRETRRLSPQPSPAPRMYFPDSQRIVMDLGDPLKLGMEPYVVSLDGSGLSKLPQPLGAHHAGRIIAEPIDLGFGGRAADLWAEPVYDVEAIVAAVPADTGRPDPPPVTELSDEMRLEQAIATWPASDQEITRHVSRLGQVALFHDPVTYALEFVKEYHRLGHTALPSDSLWVLTQRDVQSRGDFRAALVRDRVVRHFGSRAATMGQKSDWYTPEIGRTVGERMADALSQDPGLGHNQRRQSDKFVQVLSEARGLTVPRAAEPAPATKRETEAVSPPRPGDEAVDAARKARDALEQLWGIFGK